MTTWSLPIFQRFLKTLALIASLCGCVISGDLIAQSGAPSVFDSLYHSSWTARDGAPSDINDFAQDRDGYLWIATKNGLYRFDGVHFERFVPAGGSDLYSDNVFALLALPEGGLWISYASGGAGLLIAGFLTNYTVQAGLGSDAILQFRRAPNGEIWAAAQNGLLRFSGGSWRRIGAEAGVGCTSVSALMFDDKGTQWISCENTILYRRAGEITFRKSGLVFNDLASLIPGRDGIIWASGINGQVTPYRLSADTFLHAGRPIPARSMNSLIDRLGRLWIATTSKGLICMGAADTQAKAKGFSNLVRGATFTKLDGLTSNEAEGLLEDREGNIWVKTAGGLDRFRQTQLVNVSLPSGTSGPTLAVDGNGAVLVTTGAVAPGIERITMSGVESLPHAPAYLTSSYRDFDGTYWFGGLNSLWHFADNHFTRVALPAGLPSRALVHSIVTSVDGDLWVSFFGAHLFRLRKGTWARFGAHEGWPDSNPLHMQRDSFARLWFAYSGNRVVQLIGDQLKTFSSTEGINVGDVTAVTEVGGQVLIGGQAGLQVLDDGHFFSLTDQSGPLKNVSGIVFTRAGDLWLSESSGAVRITNADWKSFVSDHTYRVNSRLFDVLDGSSGTPYPRSRLPSMVQSSDGLLWFLSAAGLTHLDPESLHTNTIRPTVLINSIKADQVTYPMVRSLRLPKGTNNIQVNYTALSLSIPERVNFRYKLEGYDKVWSDAGTRRQAFYSQLPPGTYSLHVLASNDDGLWNEEGTTAEFVIPPTFLQSLPFKIAVGVAFLLLLWALYLARMRQVTSQIRTSFYARLAERERIARDLHDTFFQGIQGLLLRFQTGTRRYIEDGPGRELFEETLRQSDEVMLQGRELVLDLRSSTLDNDDLSSTLAKVGIDFRFASLAIFEVEVKGRSRAIHPIVHEELYRLGKEAITNAFHHANAKRIEAEVGYERTCIRLSIRDDGIGLDSKILSDGFRADHWGLPGMRERSKKIGAHLGIWTRKGGGTEIQITVPASVAYRHSTKPSYRSRLLQFAKRKGPKK